MATATRTKPTIQKRVSRQKPCQYCHKPIVFIKLYEKKEDGSDKWIACDPKLWCGNGMVTLVTGTGHVYRRASHDIVGRVPHTATCFLT
jgi:hypothetical protein